MEHSIDYYRLEKTSRVNEAVPEKFNTFIQIYQAVWCGHVTDIGVIRDTAKQFAAIARMPAVNKWFPYDADQIAVALDGYASRLEMKANAGTGDQPGPHSTQADPDFQKITDEITVDFVKIREELLYQFDTQDVNEQVPHDIYSISDPWAGLLTFAEVAEQEERELLAKGKAPISIDHDDLWKEWEV